MSDQVNRPRLHVAMAMEIEGIPRIFLPSFWGVRTMLPQDPQTSLAHKPTTLAQRELTPYEQSVQDQKKGIRNEKSHGFAFSVVHGGKSDEDET